MGPKGYTNTRGTGKFLLLPGPPGLALVAWQKVAIGSVSLFTHSDYKFRLREGGNIQAKDLRLLF